MEGMLVKITRVLLALFLIISAVPDNWTFSVRIPKRLVRFTTVFYYYTESCFTEIENYTNIINIGNNAFLQRMFLLL